MKILQVILILVVVTIQGISQSRDITYTMRAEKIRSEIWGNNAEAFNVTAVPAELINESAIVIANSVEVTNSAEIKLKLVGRVPKMSYQTTIHHRVKINDKAALDYYSTLEYTKELNNNFYYGISRFFNKRDGFIGAKIIKPNGAESIVNTSEEVLTRDEKKYKEGKLAISGLEVGDILDYFIRIETIQEGFSNVQGPYTLTMGGEYPILYYHVKLRLDHSAGVKYVSANGAPSFVKSTNADNDIILELTQRNLPKLKNVLYISTLRQSPYIKLQYKLVSENEDVYTDFDRGEVKQGFSVNNVINQYKSAVRALSSEYALNPLNLTKIYFGNAGNTKSTAKDSIVKVLYNAWRYNTFFYFSTNDFTISHQLNDRYPNSIYSAINFSKMLDQLHIANTIYFVSSRRSNSWRNALNLSDLSSMVKVTETKPYWLSFDDMVTQFAEIPAKFQGEDALLIAPDANLKYSITRDQVPVTTAAENTITETITVDFDTSDLQLLAINRTSRQTGALRHNTQKKLLLMEDIEANFAAVFSQRNFAERIQSDRNLQKRADEFSAFFKAERNDLKTYFTEEITEHFGAEPKDVTAYKILEPAFLNQTKPFEYRSAFRMENFVQKAGNNYILEAGKLIGVAKKVEESERNRTMDLYIICASTYNCDIIINIPKGYHIKGVEEMNKRVSNKTGSFTCSATSDEALVHIKVQILNEHNLEKAEDGPKVFELMDALYNLSGQKLLLEKD